MLKSMVENSGDSSPAQYNLIVYGERNEKILFLFESHKDVPRLKGVFSKEGQIRPAIIAEQKSSMILVFSSAVIFEGKVSPGDFEVIEVKYSIRDNGLIAEQVKLTPEILGDVILNWFSKLDEIDALNKAIQKK